MSKLRKTRIVCISDTHNQTPKLPRGDVLIHAGDLTNQGSHSELEKTVEWFERQEFEAKIFVTGTDIHFESRVLMADRYEPGNHDITLDEPFFREHENSWKWPDPQDPESCRKLLTESKSITYLENTSATIRLTGPGTSFRVFGSPCTPKQANWAFQYTTDKAEEIWSKIPDGVDIVVTHTPPKGHCDGSAKGLKDGREGCPALLSRLEKIRPLLSVCGHIHGGRGVETVRWRTLSPTDIHTGNLEESVEFWNDPGASNKKLSLVDLTIRSRVGRGLGCEGASLTRQRVSDSLRGCVRGQPGALPEEDSREPPSGDGKSSSLTDGALRGSEALWGGGGGGAKDQNVSDVGHGCPDEATRGMPSRGADVARRETTVINAAYLGPRVAGKPLGYNKPIVVDVELPVWDSSVDHEVG
jgi:Icc-related predicted phosphoesterase